MLRLRAYSAALLFALSMLPTAWAADGKASVTLNLKNADIGSLITTVSQVTGKNFIVDPRVKGKVTVISSSPMDPASLYATFLSVLEVQGFTAVPSGQVIKIVPVANAREEAAATSVAGVPRDQIVTEVFNLQNASAAQLVPILRPLVPQWGHLAAYAPNNMLIVADRAGNIERLARIISDIDRNGDQGLDVVPLKYAAASDVAHILTVLAQQSKQIDPTAHPPAVLTDTRTNSVLIAGDRTDRIRLLDAIKQLDVPSSNSGDTQVIYLHYADAEKLAPILQGYAQKQQSAAGSVATAGGTSRAPAPAPSTSGASGGIKGVTVIPDKDTNALVITAPPKTMQLLRHIIAQLDIRRAQVLVDGIVAEVSANKATQLGLDSAIFNPNRVATANILNPNTLQSLSSAAGSVASGGGTSTNTLVSAAAGLVSQGLNAAAGVLSSGGTSFVLLLKALKSDGDTNILSTPTLVTLDNQEAKFEVGQDVPFLTGQFSNTGVSSANGQVNPFQTFERKDVGLKLGITPTINEGNTIRLKINLEDSSLSSGTAGTANLITNKRTITNTVLVESGQILVIGGLIDNQLNEQKNGVPFLSDIPLLGSLFTYRSESRTRRNLMVFIHPVILRDSQDAGYYSRLKYGELRRAQLNATTGGTPLVGGTQPVLYPWNEYLRQHNGHAGTSAAPVAPGSAPTKPAPTGSAAGAPAAPVSH